MGCENLNAEHNKFNALGQRPIVPPEACSPVTSPPPSEKLSGSLVWKRKAEIRSVTPSLSKVVRPLSALLNGRPARIRSGGLQASAPASAVHRLLLRARAAAIECPPLMYLWR